MTFDTSSLDRFPKAPGVYIMKDAKGAILYIGKANNLFQRVRQYFAPGRDSRVQIPFLVAKIVSIEVIVVTNEKEALLLENTLIKQHQPRYNILLRDDKSYVSLKINHQHAWPQVSLHRYKGRPKEDALYFGPYTSSYAAGQMLDFIHRFFPLRQCSDQELERRTRPCILHGMKRCLAPCVDRCTPEDYQALVHQVTQLLKGQDKEVIRHLKEEMQKASDQLEFERAGHILKTLQALEKMVEQQLVDQINGRDADVIGLYRAGTEVVLTEMTYRQGRLMGAQHFPFSHVIEEDEELLTSFLLQRYSQKEELPKEIYLSIPLEESKLIAEILLKEKKGKLAITCPKIGEGKALVNLAIENARHSFERKKEKAETNRELLLSLQEKLQLSRYPKTIECFDNSNLSGKDPVAASISFVDGVTDKKRYRKFKLEPSVASDDYRALEEVLRRRLQRGQAEGNLPDLIIIDGGKGHLNTALNVLKSFDAYQGDIISLAKEDRRHDKGITLERVFTPACDEPICLNFKAPELFFLQRVRDEAHRFVIEFQKKQRSKQTTKSALDLIPGIGPKKKTALLRRFGSVQAIRQAQDSDLKAVPGINTADIAALHSYLSH
ncbi:MAG: uvrC [Chlamydiales bacterium]|nr:uvrC [Chlamydiales bacterium]